MSFVYLLTYHFFSFSYLFFHSPSCPLNQWYSGPTLFQAIKSFKDPLRRVDAPLRAVITSVISENAKGKNRNINWIWYDKNINFSRNRNMLIFIIFNIIFHLRPEKLFFRLISCFMNWTNTSIFIFYYLHLYILLFSYFHIFLFFHIYILIFSCDQIVKSKSPLYKVECASIEVLA